VTALPLVGTSAMADEETETQRIERELDILRTRRNLYLKWAGPKTIYMAIVAAAIITILLAVVVSQTVKDPFMGLFIVAMVAIIGGLLWLGRGLLSGTSDVPNPDPLRRVSIVHSRPRANGLVPLYKVYMHPYSIMTEIDEMIARREQRLSELKGMQS
jgi:hypothetical protein